MFVGSAHSEILFFRVHTFVRERKMGERKRIVRIGGGGGFEESLRLERRGGKRRKLSIQWSVSSREDTYVMLDLNATKREKSGRRREKVGLKREGGERGSREVAVDEQ